VIDENPEGELPDNEDVLDGKLPDDTQKDASQISASPISGEIHPGEKTEIFSAYDRSGNILSNVDFLMSDGRVFTSNAQGHAVLPAGMDFSCDYNTVRCA
jgi:hypothetical protein